MDWSKITSNTEVINLLKKRKEIELEIISIDKNALVMYELEMLSIPNNVQKLICIHCESKNINVDEKFCNNCSEYLD